MQETKRYTEPRITLAPLPLPSSDPDLEELGGLMMKNDFVETSETVDVIIF